ncbi:helix-turn-helix domain-containing protein [Variovorax gossypii]
MPQKKPIGDAKLAAFEASQDFEALLVQSARGMGAGKTRKVYTPVVAARENAGLSQAGFAQLLGVSVRTLQQWEQGRREPTGAAKTLIAIAEKMPEALRAVDRNSPLKAVVDGRVLYGVMSATCWSRPKPTRQARPSQ